MLAFTVHKHHKDWCLPWITDSIAEHSSGWVYSALNISDENSTNVEFLDMTKDVEV